MLRVFFALWFGLALSSATFAATIDELFTVKTIEGKEATVEGPAKGLKAGGFLYFARSPFKFAIADVKGNVVTLTLPEKHDLGVGQTLLREPNAQIKKSLSTESRLKEALEE